MSGTHDAVEIARLRDEVEVLKMRLTDLTGVLSDESLDTQSTGDTAGVADRRTDRRGLLKVAGSATIGAVGASLLSVGSAAALTASWTGLYRGICVNNEDPEELGRITARVPDVYGSVVSGWAMPSFPVGWTGVPAVGDDVWIAFEGGKSEYPVWVGVFGQRVTIAPT